MTTKTTKPTDPNVAAAEERKQVDAELALIAAEWKPGRMPDEEFHRLVSSWRDAGADETEVNRRAERLGLQARLGLFPVNSRPVTP
jgi:hypothetical protein